MPQLKLTDIQRVILTNAAGRDSGLVLPLPKSLAKNAGTIARTLQSILDKELVAEREATSDEEVWKTDETRGRLTLTISPLGLQAIGVEGLPDGEVAKSATKRTKPPAKGAKTSKATTASKSKALPSDPKPTSKLGILIGALRGKKGATIAELIDATGWQAHSIRGAISGALKKQRGLDVTSAPIEGRGRVYRVSE